MCGVGEKGELIHSIIYHTDINSSLFFPVADRRPIDPPRKLTCFIIIK